MKRKQSLLAGVLLCGLFAAMDLFAADLHFSDGNGNRFTLSEVEPAAAKETSQTLLTYEPIRPSESSSGEYSGGEKRTVVLGQMDGRRGKSLFLRAVAAGASHVRNREKGTCVLHWREGDQSHTVILRQGSSEGQAIEEFLRLCLAGIQVTYAIDRGDDPWHGLTGSAEEEERTRHIRARTFPAGGFTALVRPALAWQGQPLLYRGNREGKEEVALDDRFFTDMERADATRLSAGSIFRMGMARTNELLRPEFLIPFLLQSQLIITYWHTNADLHIEKEYLDGPLRCFRIEGEHHFFTNKHNVHPIRFSICSDSASREIWVKGN